MTPFVPFEVRPLPIPWKKNSTIKTDILSELAIEGLQKLMGPKWVHGRLKHTHVFYIVLEICNVGPEYAGLGWANSSFFIKSKLEKEL